MSFVAVELNDAGVIASADASADDDGLKESPGYALLHDGRVLLGAEAAARSRVAPLFGQNRFWHELGPTRLSWPSGDARTHADLAYAQLTGLVAPFRGSVDGMMVAVAPGYSREQLGLLAGISDETGVPLRGLVDVGLAACARDPSVPHLLHLDVQLHQAVVTVVEYARADGALRRTRYEMLPGAGLLAIQQSLIEFVATEFVRETRFDALHEATTEQRLFDSLPSWLSQLARSESVTAELAFGSATHRIELARGAVDAAIDRHCAELLRLVQASRPAGLAVRLNVSHRAAAIPGLMDRLDTLRDCEVVALGRGAVVRGVLANADAIARPRDGLTLVHRLPVANADVAEAAAAKLVEVPPEEIPTHVIFRGEAWPITEQPLLLGSSVGPGALALPSGIPGLSRSHCALRREGRWVIVEDRSTYGTFVNDERVVGRVALRVGDRLRLGTPGVLLELIRVM